MEVTTGIWKFLDLYSEIFKHLNIKR